MPAPDPGDGKRDSQGWYLVFVLGLVYTVHSLDRSIISVVIEPIKADLGLSDRMVGSIVGLAYAVAFCIAGIPIGALVDRCNRRTLLSILVFSWSAMTALAGLASTGAQLMASRFLVGAAEAGSTPTALSLLADSFPSARRATAAGLFSVGPGIGVIISGAVGGLLAQAYGWRAVFFLAGLPGLVLALLIFLTVREPARGAMDLARDAATGAKPNALTLAMRAIVANPALLATYLAGGLLILAMSGFSIWLMPFLIRAHDLDLGSAGLALAFTLGAGVSMGAGVGGVLSDRLGRRSPANRLYFCGGVAALCCLLGIVAFSSTSLILAAALFFTWNMVAFAHAGPAQGTMLNLLPAEARGSGTAIYQVFINLLGYGLGSYLIGSISDFIGGPDSLKWSLILVVGSSCLLSSLLYLAAGRALSREGDDARLSPA